jgi:predicted O-methyltransferase YrrM
MTNPGRKMDGELEYTNAWFLNTAKSVWDQLIPQINPTRILEIGSYEGASTCYLIDLLAQKKEIEIHCVDNWQGGIENKPGGFAESDMSAVERRFLCNTGVAKAKADHRVDLVCHKGNSDKELARLLADGKEGYFDFVYVDGSHQAPDVLCDAVLGFRLLRVNGVMAFDDYLWSETLPYGVDPIRCPKPAIDAFTNIHCRKIRILSAPLYQLYVQKIAD